MPSVQFFRVLNDTPMTTFCCQSTKPFLRKTLAAAYKATDVFKYVK